MTKRVGIADRTVTIGFVGSLLFGLLSRIVYLFKQQHPHLKIEMVEMTTNDQIQALKEGRIDVGFGRLRISDPAVKRILLREERLMVAVHSSHPFAAQKEGVYLADVVDQQLFLYPNHNKPNFSTQIRGVFSEYGLEPRKIREVRELQLALGFVAAGEGLCIVPESAQNIHLAHLHFIPLLDDSAVSPVFMAIRNMDESEDIRSLFDCIYQVYDLEAFTYDRNVF
jgi:DNA-binding transcriptional LysR family regulator